MRLTRLLPPALLAFAAAATPTSPSPNTAPVARRISLDLAYRGKRVINSRHGDEEHDMTETAPAHPPISQHNHLSSHWVPLREINETVILETHDPDPWSYYDQDTSEEGGYPGVLLVHIALMSLAFFILLPVALFLKAGGSQLALVSQAGFLVSSVLGMVFGASYKGLSTDLYPGSSHSSLGWFTMVLTIALNACDIFVHAVTLKRWIFGKNYKSVAENEEERQELVREPKDDEASPFALGDDADDELDALAEETAHRRTDSTISGDTLFDSATMEPLKGPANKSLRAKALELAPKLHTVLMCSLVVFAYAELINGIIVYTGTCVGRYGNGCKAHTIKGSIFVWYGFITFARYIGAFSSLGWAWNRRPDKAQSIWTAEFVESLVIFTYGITNTWLERLGDHGPLGVKTVQHISVAVMFWFAGALGMLVESRTVRSWLAQTAMAASSMHSSDIVEPASASFSFNVFPALVIGITGAAMSAHAQIFQFQVDVHALWGTLLGAFAVFRLLTYFFLFLRPPASILPSRPPTEALASFCLTAGGVVFILSTEQVSFAAMRHGWDDLMAFLTFTVSLVCICLTWILALFALKGWAISRNRPAVDPTHHSHHRSASVPPSPTKGSTRGRRLAIFA